MRLTREEEKRLRVLEQDAESAYPFLASDEQSSTFRDRELIDELKSAELLKSQYQTQTSIPQKKETKPWVHFVAGGVGGTVGAVVTCPLDVVKTRLQSDVYHNVYNKTIKSGNPVRQAFQHLAETGGALREMYASEGVRSLFKGLGPNLVGVIPARSINFFTYGTTKDFLVRHFKQGDEKKEETWMHLVSGINAGFVTSTATNPIWLIKTRLQLDKSGLKVYKNSWDCLKSILKNEGFPSLYRGLSASYLGGIESTIQWVLYEQMRMFINRRSLQVHGTDPNNKSTKDHVLEWSARSGAAGLAKFMASLITYPHEVVRTRLRQAPLESTGKPKYTGLIQCFKLVFKEEGFASMYGGLTPHLLRTVPNSIIMFGTWELVVRLLSGGN
ncbi:mitochondrial carrier protein RIM2 [Lodderomyces elongisporus NRRL YB-4239]|uniref:Mitochondrial thiamine pyrophosphate carrier 1 n=1 Tax=Lodderomyces elongisporus (strain ATCC 11503 / CBS 2605 / JCM 1781 / NBRC 1676 / NRRL YB-4239) TaxID=379508 RepID=A5DX78_LODEL|nr:mitochondrial carrier protein RIM2 [Lodderomyces elongisporus NRRL YB-4239]